MNESLANIITAIITETETFVTALVTNYWASIIGIILVMYIGRKVISFFIKTFKN